MQEGTSTRGVDGELIGVDVPVADEHPQRAVVRQGWPRAGPQLVQLVVIKDVDDVLDDLVDGEGGSCLAC